MLFLLFGLSDMQYIYFAELVADIQRTWLQTVYAFCKTNARYYIVIEN